jgi:ribosomal protein S18 acetylase RimI-like enzyme
VVHLIRASLRYATKTNPSGRAQEMGQRGPSGSCKHGEMAQISVGYGCLRTPRAEDGPQLLRLWARLFDEDGTTSEEPWKGHAREWFTRYVDDTRNARFPAIEVDGELVATAIGTLEVGVPSPQCVRGRTVRLANVITLPGHRGLGHGTMLALDVVAWARSIDADRVDLSATAAGQRIYEKIGFMATSAPRMKLVL